MTNPHDAVDSIDLSTEQQNDQNTTQHEDLAVTTDKTESTVIPISPEINQEPVTPLNEEQRAAHIELWTEFEPIPQSLESMTKTDRKKLLSKVAKTRELKEIQANSLLFDSDSMDSEIRDYIINERILDDMASEDYGRVLYGYNQRGFWTELPDEALSPRVSRILDSVITNGYNGGKLKNVTGMVRERLNTKPTKKSNVIGFKNCAFNVASRKVIKHSKTNGLSSVADYNYDKNQTECPNFENWLSHSCTMFNEDGSIDEALTLEKTTLMMAGLYMVAANKYEWQLYLEIFGAGGTGKSIFLLICEMLVGKENRISLGLDDIECSSSIFGLESIIGKSLILSPDVKKMASDFNNLKAITGGDPLPIKRKGLKSITLDFVPAVVVITGNQPMAVTDQSSGLWRRRVVISMKNIVDDSKKDSHLSDKLHGEIGAIFNKILNYFESDSACLEVMRKAVKSEEKLEAAEETDPLLRWVSECLMVSEHYQDVVQVGGYDGVMKSNQTDTDTMLKCIDLCDRLYPNYSLYCRYVGVTRPLALNNFSGALKTLCEKMEKYKPIKYTRIKGTEKKGFIGMSLNKTAPHLIHFKETIDKNKYREVH